MEACFRLLLLHVLLFFSFSVCVPEPGSLGWSPDSMPSELHDFRHQLCHQ